MRRYRNGWVWSYLSDAGGDGRQAVVATSGRGQEDILRQKISYLIQNNSNCLAGIKT